MLAYLFALAGTFVSVFLKGFQHKNVIHNLYIPTAVTSYLMAFLDVMLINLVAKSDWSIAFASGTGAAAGMVLAMWIHNKYMHKGKEDGRRQEGTEQQTAH